MKTILKKLTAVLAVIIILYASCKNPADDVEIIVNTDIFKSPTLIQFVNAKKGATGPQDFTVQITGPNADLVRTSTGGRTYKASSGLLNLVLDRNANPTQTNPVQFTVSATVPGFAPVFQDVIIYSATQPTFYKVAVAEYANPVAGSSSLVTTRELANGTTNSEVTLTTPTNTGLTLNTAITIPTGTSFFDATGAPISGSQLESRIIYSGSGTNGLSPVLTGGNVSRNVIDANGKPILPGAYLATIGAVTIDMFAGGREVKSFSKPLIVDMEIKQGMINPSTQQAIKAGETMPMFSLNDETGQWKAEGNANVINNTAGKLFARMSITHLSVWAIFEPIQVRDFKFTSHDIAFPVFDAQPFFCQLPVTVTRPASANAQTFGISGGIGTEFVDFGPGETTKTVTVTKENSSAKSITVQPVATGSDPVPTYVENVLSSAISFGCNAVQTFNFVAPPAAEVINADVYVRFDCTNKSLQTGINAIIKVTPVGATEDQAQFYNLVNGKASGSMRNGVTYEIVASVDGTTYKSQFKADKNNFVLPSGFDLSGSAAFDPATNRLKIEGFVRRNCN